MLTIPGRIPIRIHPFFWIISGLIGWLTTQSMFLTLLWVIVIFYSVLIHEFGHALTARYFGQEAEINLVALGGVTQRRGKDLSSWREFFVVLNGPLFGLLMYAIGYQLFLLTRPETSVFLRYIILITVYINFYWSIINLLPIQPLDGGKLLCIFFEGFFGLTGLKIALFLSLILSIVISIFFFTYLHNPLMGGLFLLFTFESFQTWRNTLPLTSFDRDESLQELLKDAEDDLRQGHTQEAWDQLTEIRRLVDHGVIYNRATQYIAALLAAQQRFDEAYSVLLPIQKKLDPEHLHLLHQLAYRTEDWNKAIQLGNRIYRSHPGYETALINSYSYSMMGKAEPAIEWLHCAIREGLPNVQMVLHRKEFDKIRSDSRFQELFH